MPELPEDIEKRLVKTYGLNMEQASILTYADPALAGFFEDCAKRYKDFRKLANWLVVEVLGYLNSQGKEFYASNLPLRKKDFLKFLGLMDSGRVTARIGQELVGEFVEGEDLEKLLKEKGIELVRDLSEVKRIVGEVVQEFPQAVMDYKAGKRKAVNFLVGMTLKKTNLGVDPETAEKLIIKEID